MEDDENASMLALSSNEGCLLVLPYASSDIGKRDVFEPLRTGSVVTNGFGIPQRFVPYSHKQDTIGT